MPRNGASLLLFILSMLPGIISSFYIYIITMKKINNIGTPYVRKENVYGKLHSYIWKNHIQ